MKSRQSPLQVFLEHPARLCKLLLPRALSALVLRVEGTCSICRLAPVQVCLRSVLY